MCGVGGKADRRPIDPPPIVQLRVIDPLAASSSASARGRHSSPSGRRSTDSDDEEDELMDDGEQERLVAFYAFSLLPHLTIFGL